MQSKIVLAAIILAYLVIGSLYAFNTPDWQAPDEPAHYNYIRQLADGVFPVIETGDWDHDYQSLVVSSGFDPRYDVSSFEYEDYQPPLYYLIATPVYAIFDGELGALRILSLLLGAFVIILTYATGKKLFPSRHWLALTAAAFLAFLPQHVAMLASVNNDSLAELLIAAILFVLISFINRQAAAHKDFSHQNKVTGLTASDQRSLTIAGVLLGLGFISKVTVYIMAPMVALTLLWLLWGRWRLLIRAGVVVFLPALLIGMGWWVRNVIVYDQLDPLGTLAHNAIVVGQPQTSDWIADNGLVNTLRFLVKTLFQSFWGQFGWMGVVMPCRVYQLLLAFSLLTGAGFVWVFVNKNNTKALLDVDGWPWEIQNWPLKAAILSGTFAMSLLLLIVYNFTFVQPQGRYLFSGLVPISFGVAISWGALLWPVIRQHPMLNYVLPLGLSICLICLDLVALFRYVVPSLG